MDLYEPADSVHDVESFLKFVHLLEQDRRKENPDSVDPFGRGSEGWENHTIEDFLAAALAWAHAGPEGISDRALAGRSPWKWCANFLLCGKIYE